MLALVVAVALSQCTKDVDCKGDRVCADGVCVEPSPVVPAANRADIERVVELDRLRRELIDLQIELTGNDLTPAGVKLVAGLVVCGFGVALDVASYSTHDGTLFYAGAVIAVVGAIFAVWGGFQLPLRATAQRRLKIDIRDHETRIADLDPPP